MSRFIVLPARILADDRFSSMTHLRVLMVLGAHTDKNGWAWPSRRQIGDCVGVSVTRVSQCIGDLKEWGYVEVYPQTRKNRGQTSNRYRVLFDVGAPESLSSPVSPANPPSESHGANGGSECYGANGGSESQALTPVVNAPMNAPREGMYLAAGHVDGRDELFDSAWAEYPKRAGGNSRRDALKAWNARLAAGDTAGAMLAGVRRYAEFCAATGKIGTEFVKQAATFFGPSRHFAEPWSIPAVQPHSLRVSAAQQRDAISEANAAAWLAGSHASDPNVIDMER